MSTSTLLKDTGTTWVSIAYAIRRFDITDRTLYRLATRGIIRRRLKTEADSRRSPTGGHALAEFCEEDIIDWLDRW